LHRLPWRYRARNHLWRQGATTRPPSAKLESPQGVVPPSAQKRVEPVPEALKVWAVLQEALRLWAVLQESLCLWAVLPGVPKLWA